MSLLLDALKRAAQEKLEKQRQDENGADAGAVQADEVLSLDIMDASADAGETPGPSGTELRLHRADVLASELQAFMGANNPTERPSSRAANETADKTAGREPPTVDEHAASTAAASPAAAARVFKNKRTGIPSRQLMLIAGAAGAFILIFAFYAMYLNSLNRSNVRVDRLLASVPPSVDEPPAATRIEKELLIEQEPIGALSAAAPAADADSAVAQEEQATRLFADNTPPREQSTPEENDSADVPRTASTAEAGNGASADTLAAVPRLRVRKSNQETLHAILLRAFNAYQSGDIAAAEAGYRQALARAPQSRDALLGFAAASIQQGDYAAAMESYATLLQLDPNDDLALAGITALKQDVQGMPADESLLRALLLKRPDSAQLHFALGNHYAAASDWPKAQSAYFDAHRHEGRNPDYAYNLAVSLEHLQQPATALRYYQLALTLAGARKPNFDVAQAAARVSTLQTQLQDTATDAR